ncbi:MAG TPA: hypothetical protein VMC41_04615 [Candidatus Nanoarchaeia archaeon]|nr:hypothetical protein [Candidatus Nanoarchaeia archaeon]
MNIFKKLSMIFRPRLLRRVKVLELDACDGKVDISLVDKVFAFASSLFKDLMVVVGLATPQMKVAVYELVRDAKFVDIFTSLSSDLDRLCLTQGQIIEFCRNHSEDLSRDGITSFLFKVNGEYFVADVRVRSDGLYARVCRFGDGGVWRGGYRPRVVVPQL